MHVDVLALNNLKPKNKQVNPHPYFEPLYENTTFEEQEMIRNELRTSPYGSVQNKTCTQISNSYLTARRVVFPGGNW